jgi:hypothetical protein
MAEITISDAELFDYPYIRAVLAYLDQTTTSQERFTASETDQAVDIPKSNLRDSLAERLRLSFKLRHTMQAPSPIGKELRHFRLYYPPDAADALAAAWCARQRGGSALAALQADYGEDCTRGVILRRENWPDPKRPDWYCFREMQSYAEDGDEFFSWEDRSRDGYVLFRGGRRVDYFVLSRFFPSPGCIERFSVEYEAYNAAGGSLAVIEGRLTWPPL